MNKSENKAKITFFFPNLEVGGAERVTVNLLKAINKNDFSLSLVLGKKKGYFIDEVPSDVPVISLETIRFPLLFLRLIRYLHKERPDIFISVFPRFNVISIIAKIFLRTKTKIIIIEHNPFSLVPMTAKTLFRRLIARFLFPFLMKFLYPKANILVCASKGIAEDLSNIVYMPNRIKILYNPIIDDQLRILAREPLKHPWFLNQRAKIVLAVGRLVRAKDYPTLLEAFNLVLQKIPAYLVIVGEGQEREKLRKITEKLGISEKVAFLGFQKNPYKYMAKASIFVLSSIQEGFPTVLIEAMACGLPIISTDCKSGPNEIIENGKNGILVLSGEKKALAEAIIRLLEDSSLRKKFSEEGKKRAQNFIIKKSAKEYEQLFSQLLNDNA